MHHQRPLDRRELLAQGARALLVMAAGAAPAWLHAQTVELLNLQALRADGALSLEFATRVSLPRAVEDALQRGVPIYFVAQATLLRNRWYWRDERVARVSRTWRVAYQPLTATWRVGLGGLNQSHPTLADALAAVTRSSQWRLADLTQIDPDSRHYIEFSWKLDTAQLPGPMLIGLVGSSEFTLGVERTLRLD